MAKRKKNVFTVKSFQPNNEVTASSIMVEVDGLKILMDLGLLQNSHYNFKQTYHINIQRIQSIPFKELDYIITNHAHLDHAMTAIAYNNGFTGQVIATELTSHLGKVNMEDEYKINLKDVKTHGEKEYQVYFNQEHIDLSFNETRCYDYDQQIRLNDHVTLELKSACHLPGACMSYLTYQDEYTTKRLLYTSDITYSHLVDRPFTKKINCGKLKVDYLVLESTYGLREKEVFEEEHPIDFLERIIMEEVVQKNRILFIPSFAIHRSTELYYYLYKIFERNEYIRKANIPVRFCGKLMQQAHNIIGKKEMFCYYDEQWQNERDIWDKEPFDFLTTIEDVQHFCMNNGRQIVISSSGMFDKGFSNVLSKFYIPNDKVSILACGYLAENSLGWKIKNGFKEVDIGGLNRQVRCEFKGTIPSLSGHATHQGLIDFVKSLNQSVLKNVILVHGTTEAKEELKEDLEKELGKNKNIYIIKQFETLKF